MLASSYVISLFHQFMKNNHQKLYQILARCARNFYFISSCVFVVWVLFVDNNDLFTHLQLERQYRQLKQEQAYYVQQTADIRRKHQQLKSDPDMIERMARERFLLRKAGEEVFLLQTDSAKVLVIDP